MKHDNFIEVFASKEANEIDLNQYRFLDRLSGKRGTWCFKVREGKR